MSSVSPLLTEASPGRYRLAGELTLGTVGPLRDAGRALFALRQGDELHVDLGGVTRADSAGLALLVDWLAWAKGAGRRLSFSRLPAELLALARLSELDSLLA